MQATRHSRKQKPAQNSTALLVRNEPGYLAGRLARYRFREERPPRRRGCSRREGVTLHPARDEWRSLPLFSDGHAAAVADFPARAGSSHPSTFASTLPIASERTSVRAQSRQARARAAGVDSQRTIASSRMAPTSRRSADTPRSHTNRVAPESVMPAVHVSSRQPHRAPARSERERSVLLRARLEAVHAHLLFIAAVATYPSGRRGRPRTFCLRQQPRRRRVSVRAFMQVAPSAPQSPATRYTGH